MRIRVAVAARKLGVITAELAVRAVALGHPQGGFDRARARYPSSAHTAPTGLRERGLRLGDALGGTSRARLHAPPGPIARAAAGQAPGQPLQYQRDCAQPDEPWGGWLPVLEQAHAGTCGQCGRPPPLTTPRYVDHDAKCVSASRVRVRPGIVRSCAAEREPGEDGPHEEPGLRPDPAAPRRSRTSATGGDLRSTVIGRSPRYPRCGSSSNASSSAGPTAGRVWRPRRPAGPLPPLSAWALGGRGLLIRCGRCPLHLEGSTLRPGLDLNEVSKPTASARSLTCVYARLRGVVGG